MALSLRCIWLICFRYSISLSPRQKLPLAIMPGKLVCIHDAAWRTLSKSSRLAPTISAMSAQEFIPR
jgi:hypothetical protein